MKVWRGILKENELKEREKKQHILAPDPISAVFLMRIVYDRDSIKSD